ncbi:MAG: BON domain-containing protein [Holosporales bacterium]|nr:BON domain-containing protein [Holosporales bacterium]
MPVSIAIYIGGCAPIIIGGSMATGGYVTLRDKRIGNSLIDTQIETGIKKKLYKVSHKLYSIVSVNANNGAVILTGTVTKPEWVNIAERAAWAVEGVVSVDNNLVYGEEIPFSQIMKDGFITSSAKSKLLCSKEVKSINYKVKTMNGVVYLTGIAQSEKELDIAISEIQSIGGVKKVVSYVNIKHA